MNLGKTMVVARREYQAAVRSKAFLVSLVLMPIMMGGGMLTEHLSQKIGDTNTYTIAVRDDSPGASLYTNIAHAVQMHNQHGIFNQSGRQIHGQFILKKIESVDWHDKAALDRQRLALSNQVRSGQLLAFVEIGPEVLNPHGNSGDAATIRYSTNRPTYQDFLNLLRITLSPEVLHLRLQAAGADYQRLAPLLAPPAIMECGLAEDRGDKITYATDAGELPAIIVPLAMIMMMFVVTMVGTSQIAANVIEEKQLRIAEVLLGSITPFEFMMGKLLGGAGVSLTLAVIFFGGAYYVADSQGVAAYVPARFIAWFFFFIIISTFMYGSLFVAAGSACNNLREMQSFIMPVMLVIVLPLLMLSAILQNPSGLLATALSFFPLATPMVMLMRITVPPGVAAWQPLVGGLLALLATAGMVWIAGRIFRVGILMQGKGANYAAICRWIIRG